MELYYLIYCSHLIHGGSFDDNSTCAAAVANVVLQSMEPFGKSRPWCGTPCKLANFAYSKLKAYYIWTKAMVTKDLKVKASEV